MGGTNPDRLSVMTFNLRFGLADDGANGWEFRRRSVGALLRNFQADFMGFQEVNHFQADFLQTLLSAHRLIGQRQQAPPFWQNNLIFYHRAWRCVHREHFFLSATPGIPSRFPDSRWPRQCTLGVFQSGSRRLACINTHFDFEDDIQVRSARIILQRLAQLPASQASLLLGDFNADPSRPCYRVFTGGGPETGTEGGPAFRNVCSPPFPATFHGFKGGRSGRHIDWILYHGGLAPETCRVIEDRFEGRYPSDHYPLRAVFRWQPHPKPQNG